MKKTRINSAKSPLFQDRTMANKIKFCGGKKCGSAFEWFGKPDHVETVKMNKNAN